MACSKCPKLCKDICCPLQKNESTVSNPEIIYQKRLENYYSDIINSYEPAREIWVVTVAIFEHICAAI